MTALMKKAIIIILAAYFGSPPFVHASEMSRMEDVWKAVQKEGLSAKALGRFSPFVAFDKQISYAAIVSSDKESISFLSDRRGQIKPISYVSQADDLYLSPGYAYTVGKPSEPRYEAIEFLSTENAKSIFRVKDANSGLTYQVGFHIDSTGKDIVSWNIVNETTPGRAERGQ
jgi:hypothetical protein